MDLALNSDQMFDKGQREQQLQFIEENGGHLARLRLLGRMTSSFVLDTRQPLSVIVTDSGTAQRLLASGDEVGRKIEALLSRIIECAHWADDVVSFADRMIARRASTCVCIDLNAIGKTAVQFVQCESFSKSVPVNYEQSPVQALVAGDEVQLLQVIVTLLIHGIQEQSEQSAEPRAIHLRTILLGGKIIVIVGRSLAPDTAWSTSAEYNIAPMDSEIAICQAVIEAHKGLLEHFWDGSCSMFRLTLPHFSSQPEPCLSSEVPSACEAVHKAARADSCL